MWVAQRFSAAKHLAHTFACSWTWTSAPSPPSPSLRDRHMVVRGYNAPCICTPCWAYAVRAGFEPADAARITRSALPRRRVVPASRCDDYLLVLIQQHGPLLVQQRCQPVRFLYPRVEFPILFREIVRLPLHRRDTHRADELDFGACRATLRRRRRDRKFTVRLVANIEDVPLGK